MSAPSPPPIPDPTATASAQAEANAGTATAQTALNNANVYTPLGSSTYAVTGSQSYTNPDGTTSTVPTYTNMQTLSPSQQKLYNQQTQIAGQENQGASQLISNASQDISNPLTGGTIQTSIDPQTANLISDSVQPTTAMTSNVNQGPIQNSVANNANQIQTSVNLQGSVPNNANEINTNVANNSGNIQTSIAGQYSPVVSSTPNYASAVQTSIDPGAAGILQQLGGLSDPSAIQAAQNAAYAQMSPALDQQQAALESQLASQGIAPGSTAYNNAMSLFGQQRNNAISQSVLVGQQEQAQLYGQGLSSGEFQNAADAQMYNQISGAGAFHNAAVGQQYNQTAGANAFANAASMTGYQEAQGAGTFANAAVGQQEGQDLAVAAANNTALGQQYGQNLSAGTFANTAALDAGNFANTALGQVYGQNVTAGNFANAAQSQNFSEGQANANLANSVNAQQYNQGMSNAQLANNVAAQAYNQNSAAAQFGNQAAAQTLQQQQTINSQSINDLSALLHGGQVSMSQFQPYQTADIGTTPISQDTYASANLANQQYAQQVAMYGSDMSALGSIGGAVGGALIKSDPDLKDDHGIVGMLSELPIHEFNYKGDDTPLYGFMADEVERKHPGAVMRMRDGFRAVDYARVLAHG